MTIRKTFQPTAAFNRRAATRGRFGLLAQWREISGYDAVAILVIAFALFYARGGQGTGMVQIMSDGIGAVAIATLFYKGVGTLFTFAACLMGGGRPANATDFDLSPGAFLRVRAGDEIESWRWSELIAAKIYPDMIVIAWGESRQQATIIALPTEALTEDERSALAAAL